MTDETLFTEALERADAAERSAYLATACPDAEQRARVESLLAAHDRAAGFLDRLAVITADADSTRSADAAATRPFDPPADEPDATALLAPPGRPGSLGRIGQYEVLEVLGRGGFGIVYRAFDDKLQRVVAVKVLAPHLGVTSPARKRFLREARSAAAVSHPNVVQVFAVEEQPLPFLVMEYIPGDTLQQRIDRTGPLELSDCLRIGRQIAAGLAAAHATGLIHRDIKPSNILLDSGPSAAAKITDFGLARAADDASLTRSGTVAGTPMYMAPEQARGEPLDHRADLFSLGSVLYVMASGRPPFRANGTLAVLKRVADDTPRPIREIIPEVPEWYCRIVEKLHAKDPAGRFQSATEVADVLTDCETQLAERKDVTDFTRIPGGKPKRKWKWAAVAGGLLAFAALWVLALYVFSRPTVPMAEMRPTTRTEEPPADGFTPLFNGKDLTGWKEAGSWHVVGGILVGTGSERYLFSERDDYRDFHLRVEAKISALGNSGVHVRSQLAPGLPPGYEAQINVGTDRWKTGSLFVLPWDFDTSVLHYEQGQLVKEEEWFTLEVLARGARIEVRVEGKTVADVRNDRYAAGHIALQGGRAKTEIVQFRKIEIKELPPGTDSGNARTDEPVTVRKRFGPKDSPLEPNHMSHDGTAWQVSLPASTTVGLFRAENVGQASSGSLVFRGWIKVLRFENQGDELHLCAQWEDQTHSQRGSVGGGIRPTNVWEPWSVTLNAEPGTKVSAADFGMRNETKVWATILLKDVELVEITSTGAGPSPALPERAADLLPFLRGTWSRDGEIARRGARVGPRVGGQLAFDTMAGGTVMRGLSVDESATPTSLILHSFDAKTDRLGSWYFGSDGTVTASDIGTYDPANRTFHWSEKLPGSGQSTHKLIVADGSTVLAWHYDTNAEGKLVFEEGNTFTRSALPPVVPKVVIDPKRPAEAGVLDRLVGEWRTEVTSEALNPPFRRAIEAWQTTGRTTLGGRFVELFSTSKAGSEYAVVWYDAAAKGYRQWYFNADGHAFAMTGTWDAATSTMTWETADKSKTGRWVFKGADVREFRHTVNDKDGQPAVEMAGESKRVPSAPPPAVAPFDEKAAKAHQEAWAKHLNTTPEVESSVGMKLRLVPPGEFDMGASKDEAGRYAALGRTLNLPAWYADNVAAMQPRHRVAITAPLYVAATEVTVGQFKRFVKATGHRTEAERDGKGGVVWNGMERVQKAEYVWATPGYPTDDDRPVTQVSWADAVAFCKWLSEADGRAYRLPTEAEWEFACRAGTTSAFSTGDTLPAAKGNCEHRADRPEAVGSFPANPWGLFDLHGNVYEWCHDFHSATYYADSPRQDPTGPDAGPDRVIRGGSWDTHEVRCGSAYRSPQTPAVGTASLGFRVVSGVSRTTSGLLTIR